MFGLPAIAWKLIGIGVILLTLLGVGARLASIWYSPQIKGLQAQHQAAVAKSHQLAVVTKRITVVSQRSEKAAQATLATQARVIKQKVYVHVHDPSPAHPVPCISWGMLRLHDAAVGGISPDDLALPVGQSDDACSPVAPSVFVAAVADNYAAARANAEQLDALVADINDRRAVVAAADAPAPDLNPRP